VQLVENQLAGGGWQWTSGPASSWQAAAGSEQLVENQLAASCELRSIETAIDVDSNGDSQGDNQG